MCVYWLYVSVLLPYIEIIDYCTIYNHPVCMCVCVYRLYVSVLLPYVETIDYCTIYNHPVYMCVFISYMLVCYCRT